MRKIYVKIISLLSLFFVVSCLCGPPLRITPIQRGDKKLNCKDVILEINETEHHRDMAYQERGVSMGETLMPVCWVSGFMSGEKAIAAAEQRIEYLSNIYNLLNCGGDADYAPAQQSVQVQPAAPVQPQPPVVAPMMMPPMQQPMMQQPYMGQQPYMNQPYSLPVGRPPAQQMMPSTPKKITPPVPTKKAPSYSHPSVKPKYRYPSTSKGNNTIDRYFIERHYESDTFKVPPKKEKKEE